MAWWLAALIAILFASAFFGVTAFVWLMLGAVWIAAGVVLNLVAPGTAAILAIALVPFVVGAIRPLRRAIVSAPLLNVFRRIMPKMSATEQAAIDAGTVWWDADLFSGAPEWEKLLATRPATLSAEERRFVDEECETLADLSSDWESTSVWQDLPPAAWQYAKDKGFLGMIIPKRYGGLEFSAYAQSQVVQKLSTRCSAAAVSVMVPNSLGPGELLLHYGTEAQKAHYLPRLARGEDIPCFALTSPYAGSDAASLTDIGVVCRRMWQGRETLGFRVTWNKRYITLAPVATLVGLAFRVRDPDGLLGGEDVFVPIDMVIGGAEQIGNGWRMLMECLAAGRAISLPSSNVGMAKLATGAVTAYAAFRRQFNVALGAFEGTHAPVARMAGHLYATDATRQLAAAALDIGEKPSVISAIAKYHVTERARIIVNDGMDLVGGKGVCMGPGNFLARAYQQIPIAITVEGANIMTRTLIIFGQGAIRCHPYVLPLMTSASASGRSGLAAFDRALFGYCGFMLRNVARAAAFALTGGRLIAAPRGAAPELAAYYRRATRLSTALALMSDVAMASLGGTLKRRESITGRLGDILSQLFILSAILKRYEDEGRPTASLPFVHWAAQDAIARADEAVRETIRNLPARGAAFFLRLAIRPFGGRAAYPDDALDAAVARAVQTAGPARDLLLADSWTPKMEVDPIAATFVAFDAYPAVAAIEQRLQAAIKGGRIARLPQNYRALDAWAGEAETLGLIDATERAAVKHFAVHADLAIAVDDFAPDFDMAEGLGRRTAELSNAAAHARGPALAA